MAALLITSATYTKPLYSCVSPHAARCFPAAHVQSDLQAIAALRSFNVFPACGLVSWGTSKTHTSVETSAEVDQGVHDDAHFMGEALREAEKAAVRGEVPVGAVIVSQGRIVARAYNRVETEGDPTAHAEILCIRSAAKRLCGWRLLDSTLYVTLEPCPMCAGALLQARVGMLVWGARNPLLGADGSWVSLFPQPHDGFGDKKMLSCREDEATHFSLLHPFNPKIEVRRGVLASDCSEIMKRFFQKRRKEKVTKTPTPCNKVLELSSRIFSRNIVFSKIMAFLKSLGGRQ